MVKTHLKNLIYIYILKILFSNQIYPENSVRRKTKYNKQSESCGLWALVFIYLFIIPYYYYY
jgi:hypothetical protein